MDDKRILLRHFLAALAIFADVDPQRLGPDQAQPLEPDEIWPEAPANWLPPSRR